MWTPNNFPPVLLSFTYSKLHVLTLSNRPSCTTLHCTTKQIRISIHKRNNTKNTVQTIQNNKIQTTVIIVLLKYVYYGKTAMLLVLKTEFPGEEYVCQLLLNLLKKREPDSSVSIMTKLRTAQPVSSGRISGRSMRTVSSPKRPDGLFLGRGIEGFLPRW